MKQRPKNVLFGILLIAAGIAVAYFNLQTFSGGFQKLWPALVFLAGIVFYIFYFSTRKKKNRPYLLLVATFLLVSSIILFVCAFTAFKYVEVLWPGFLAAIGLGLLMTYYYGKRKKGILAGGLVLIALSVIIWIFYSLRSRYGLVIGFSLFFIGVAFLTRGSFRDKGALAEPGSGSP